MSDPSATVRPGGDRLRRYAVRWGARLCPIALLLALGAAAADAQASSWDGDDRSAVRLIAGSSPQSTTAPLRAGLEIRLEPGWHTYWRYPGDAGVPPHFDFGGSSNIKTVDVLWPAPRAIPEQGLITIGYIDHVILPLAVVPQNREQPALLRLKIDYAVCEKLCVPAQGQVELNLGGGASSYDAALSAAETRLPTKAALGEAGALAIRAVRREQISQRSRIVVDVAVPAGASATLFAEGPTPNWALPIPSPIAGAPGGLKRFAFDLEGAPPGARYEGAQITLTAVTAGEAIEVTTTLD